VTAVLDTGWHAVVTVAELDLAAGRPLPVRVAGEAWVVLRLDGEVVALRDRCPHRRVPLSAGAVVVTDDGERLQCGYHGWAFDGSGACTDIPALGAGKVPSGMRVASAAVTVADGQVWVCPNGQ
jgi:phenylpropionate dioxygenase-like ring-hydroxylating dioxygenase large terminal subunit